MKKLFTLLLAVAGMVSTASATDYVVVASDVNITPGSTTWNVSDADNLLSQISTSGIYTLVVPNCALIAGTQYEFKIAEKQKTNTWGNAYPSANWTFKVGYTGTYTLIYYLDTNASNYVSVIALPSLRSDLYDNWTAINPSEGKYFTPDGSLSWYYDITSDIFINDYYYFRIFSAVGSRCQNNAEGENKLYSGKQIYPKASGAELVYPETEDSYFNDDNTSWAWKIAKPSYDFEKIRITTTYNTSNESWTVKADAYVSVTTNSSGYATFVSGAPLTISGATAYYATDKGNGSATAVKMTNPVANTPMLLKGTKTDVDKTETLEFKVAATGEDDPGDDNAFKAGNDTAPGSGNDADGYNYILNNDAFYLASTWSVPSNKAYLHLSQKSLSRALIFDDEATAINTVVSEETADQNYYNLSGQRIVSPAKGLYIREGKKVIMK